MRAILDWVPSDSGGRSRPPAGLGTPPYATVVRFVDIGEAWPPQNAWALVVRKIESRSTEYHWIADVAYLVDDAPHDSLPIGREFELYEGNKCVAHGKLIDEGEEASSSA